MLERIHKPIARVCHKIRHTEHYRLVLEVIACGFVALETHFVIFSIALILWALVDVIYLLDLLTGGKADDRL